MYEGWRVYIKSVEDNLDDGQEEYTMNQIMFHNPLDYLVEELV